MICPTCKETGILNQANNQEFYYCRTCKVEIELEDPPSDPYFEQDSSGEMEFPASFYESMWAMHKSAMQDVHDSMFMESLVYGRSIRYVPMYSDGTPFYPRVDYTDHGIQDALDSITKAIAKKPELPGAFQEDPPVDRSRERTLRVLNKLTGGFFSLEGENEDES